MDMGESTRLAAVIGVVALIPALVISIEPVNLILVVVVTAEAALAGYMHGAISALNRVKGVNRNDR